MSKYDTFTPDVVYIVQGDEGDVYCVTPDGEGAYWYETDDELYAAHGRSVFSNFPMACVTSAELEILRGWA